ncbi:MAG: hypothetical protein ACOZBL_04915, partial [Patescibacteria group bacterium]
PAGKDIICLTTGSILDIKIPISQCFLKKMSHRSYTFQLFFWKKYLILFMIVVGNVSGFFPNIL